MGELELARAPSPACRASSSPLSASASPLPSRSRVAGQPHFQEMWHRSRCAGLCPVAGWRCLQVLFLPPRFRLKLGSFDRTIHKAFGEHQPVRCLAPLLCTRIHREIDPLPQTLSNVLEPASAWALGKAAGVPTFLWTRSQDCLSISWFINSLEMHGR